MELPKVTYKIVYLEKDNPTILYSRLFDTKDDLIKFANENLIKDYLATELVEQSGRSYVWQIKKDGLGEEFIKNYKSFETMRTLNQRLVFFGSGVVGGLISFAVAKKFITNDYANAFIGIIGSIASMNLYLKLKTK